MQTYHVFDPEDFNPAAFFAHPAAFIAISGAGRVCPATGPVDAATACAEDEGWDVEDDQGDLIVVTTDGRAWQCTVSVEARVHYDATAEALAPPAPAPSPG